RGGVRVSEVWAADWAAVGVEKKDFAPFYQLAAFQQRLARSLPGKQSLADGLDALAFIDGFPLKIRRYTDGEARHETRLSRARSGPATAALFEPPKGYARWTNFSLPLEAERNRLKKMRRTVDEAAKPFEE
ncbi:MAG: DUF4412 domain-containing protein, partial [Verrucomicrobiota bacterium]